MLQQLHLTEKEQTVAVYRFS